MRYRWRHAPALVLCRPLSVCRHVAAVFGWCWTTRRHIRHHPGLHNSRNWPVGVVTFPRFLRWLLVGPASDGHGGPRPRLFRIYGSGSHRTSGAYDSARSQGLGHHANCHRHLRRGLLHRDRGMASGRGDQRNPRPRDGPIPYRRHGRIAGGTTADRCAHPCRLCKL